MAVSVDGAGSPKVAENPLAARLCIRLYSPSSLFLYSSRCVHKSVSVHDACVCMYVYVCVPVLWQAVFDLCVKDLVLADALGHPCDGPRTESHVSSNT